MSLLKPSNTAFAIFFLIALIYMHPAILGKVDTPIDIRDVGMYPWRYWTVDKKIEKIKLCQTKFANDVFVLKAGPHDVKSLILEPNFSEESLKKLDRLDQKRCYVTCNFKPDNKFSTSYSFGIILVNKNTGLGYSPKALLSKQDIGSWYNAYFPLDGLVSDLPSLLKLKDYDVRASLKNNSATSEAVLQLRDLKLACDDFSKTLKIKNPILNDLIQWFTPAREYFSNSIKKGRLPFWTNDILTGAEFLSEPQVGYFHPLYFLLYFLFDHFTAHILLLFICLVLAGFGTYLLCRHWGLSYPASLFAGVVFIFHPFNATWFSFEHVPMNSAILPFLLLLYDKSLAAKKLLNYLLLLSSLILGLIFISGHLQHVYYTVILFFLYAFCKLIFSFFRAQKYFVKNIFSLFFVLFIGILIGMESIIPFFPTFLNSYRVAIPDEMVRTNSLELKKIIISILSFKPNFPVWSEFMNEAVYWDYFKHYSYFGILPLLFGFFGLKTVFRNKLVVFFMISIIFSILVAIGSPFFFMVRDFIPGFKQLQHYRFLQVYSYCVPFVAAIGFEEFLRLISVLRKKILLIVIVLVICFTSADLMYHSSCFVSWHTRASHKFNPRGGGLDFLLKQKKTLNDLYRVLPFAVSRLENTNLKLLIAHPNTLQTYGIEELSGYSSFPPKDLYNLFAYIQTHNPEILYLNHIVNIFPNTNIPFPIYNFKSKVVDLLNVKYFLVPDILKLEDEHVKEVFKRDCTIYENLDYLPRAFVVPDYKVIESPKETILCLDSQEFDPNKTVILMTKPRVIASSEMMKQSRSVTVDAIKIPLGAMQSHNDIQFINYEPENIKLKVQVGEAGFLILGHNLTNNWRVKINGKEGKHYQANLVQRAVYLPKAGKYNIEFYYFPMLFLIGLSITLFTLVILLILAVYLKLKTVE